MKKILIVVMAGLMMMTLISCGAKPQATPEVPVTEEGSGEKNQEPNKEAEGSTQSTGENIFGKVKNIIGNEVELELAKPPFEPNTVTEEGKEGMAVPAAAVSGAVTVTEKDVVISDEEAGGMEGGANEVTVVASGADGSVQIIDRNSGGNSLELEYTGETKSVTIPTGIDIVSMLTGKNAKLEDIKKGSVLMVLLQDNKTNQVTIME